jgi:hypothetical protein
MKKGTNSKDDLRKEYDFSGGVRGKHLKKLKKGFTTVIHKSDGTLELRETRLIALEPDVQAYFPDSRSANRALRGLIELLPEHRQVV